MPYGTAFFARIRLQGKRRGEKAVNVKTIMLFMLCLTIWLSPGGAEAFGYHVNGGNIYGHQSLDGAISYFVTDERGTWSLKGDYARLSLHKVFPANGDETLYYFFVEVADAKVKKNPVTDVIFFINGKAVDSEPFPGTAAITRDKIFRGWYKLPAGIEKALTEMETVVVELQSNGTLLKTIKTSGDAQAALKRLPAIKKEQYVREGKVVDTPQESVKRILQPQLFIPNATVEDVQAALIYKTTITNKKGKDEFLYYKGYQIWKDANPNLMALEGFENVDRSQYSFVTIATRPYQDGVWVNMSLMRKKYGKKSHYYLDYDAGSSGLVSMRSYWRSKAEDWAQLLLDVQHEFYGRYDYGITWKKEMDAEAKEGSLFRIQAVDAMGFPMLNGVAAGDVLVAVNGVATSFMKPLDLNYLLDANGDPVILTIKTKDNEEKTIAVTPQFKPSPPLEKDYKTMIGPVSKRFVKVEKRGLKFAVEPSFHPLEMVWGLP